MNKTTKLIIAIFTLQTMFLFAYIHSSEKQRVTDLKNAYQMYIEDKHELTNQLDCIDVRFSTFKVDYDAIHESRLIRDHRGF